MEKHVQQAILEVADEIEVSTHYSGEDWWNDNLPEGERGCAIPRILIKLGSNVLDENDNFATLTSVDGLSQLTNGFRVKDEIVKVTNNNSKLWHDFGLKSICANGKETASMLRNIVYNNTL